MSRIRDKNIGGIKINDKGKREKFFGYVYIYDLEMLQGLSFSGSFNSKQEKNISPIGNKDYPKQKKNRKLLMPNGYGAKYEVILREVHPDKKRFGILAALNGKINKWQKFCTECKRVSQAETKEGLKQQFYTCRVTKDGFSNVCKRCHNSKKDRNYSYVKKSKAKHPDRHKARMIFSAAIASGKVVRPDNCQVCLKTGIKIHGHHEDYSKPLDVIFVCSRCHADIHNKKRDSCK